MASGESQRMDPYLSALLAAAQADEPLPPLWATLRSGDLLTGTIASPRRFIDTTYHQLANRFDSGGVRKGSREQAKERAIEHAAAAIRPFNIEVSPGEETITLIDLKIYWGGSGNGVALPSMRLATDAIAGWWLAGGQPFSGGGNFFVGIAVPLDT